MKKKERGVVIYQTKSGALELREDTGADTVWASLDQIATVFERDKSVISRHIRDIFTVRELDRKATVAKYATVQKEGTRTVSREIEYFNLDVILSVGYRVNGKKATLFRQWATKTLRAHIVDGYTINKSRIAQNYEAFIDAVEKVKSLLPTSGLVDAGSALEIVKMFAETWISLDAYDKGSLPTTGLNKKQVTIAVDELSDALLKLKQSQQETSDLFGVERESGSVAGMLGNVFQTFGGADLYPSVEEKAAHLLYFIVKNHAFADGNKRSGAFAFVWFLRKAKILNTAQMTPVALTALTLLIAESDPTHKDRIIGLILLLLKR